MLARSGGAQRATTVTAVQRVKVVVRVRPCLPGERRPKPPVLTLKGDKCLSLTSPRNIGNLQSNCLGEEISYGFDRCYGEMAGQGVIFGYDVIPLLDKVIEGYNGTIFAYGNTGAGKTHTMVGTLQEAGN